VAPGTQVEGRSGLLSVIEQLQGLEVAAGEWERNVLPARVKAYDPKWLDELCLAGEVAWGRLTPRPATEMVDTDGVVIPGSGGRGSSTPSPATPLAIVTRQDLAWMLSAVRIETGPIQPAAGGPADVLRPLRPQ